VRWLKEELEQYPLVAVREEIVVTDTAEERRRTVENPLGRGEKETSGLRSLFFYKDSEGEKDSDFDPSKRK
jgi:hypothetical protein